MAGAMGSRPSILQPLIVGVVLALLVGGSAPWWWSELESRDDDATVSTTIQPRTTATTGSPSAGDDGTDEATTSSDVAGCRITIVNPLVTLFEKPDHFGLEVGRVEPGAYGVREATVVNRGVGDERWFRITADGRTGWLEDSSILIDSKSADCP